MINSPSDIAPHPSVVFAHPGYRTRWQFRRNMKNTDVDLTPILTLSSAVDIARVARDGLGLALLPDWSVAEDIREGRLCRLLSDWEIAGASFNSAVHLVYPSRSYVPGKTRAMIDFVCQLVD